MVAELDILPIESWIPNIDKPLLIAEPVVWSRKGRR